MKNRDIIITGLQPWEMGLGSNARNIALEFSRDNRVLYINPPHSRISWLKSREIRNIHKEINWGNNLYKAGDNIWVYHPKRFIESMNRMPMNALFDVITWHNNRLFAEEIRYAMQFLDFENHIHFCDSDMFRSYYLKQLLNPDLYIYYTRDNLLAVDYWKKQGRRYEPAHMANADLVLSNSEYLANLARKFNRNSHFVGQGCDLAHFVQGEFGARNLPFAVNESPVIGYVGALNALRLDINIIEAIAVEKPNWQLVLVGPEDEDFKHSRLHELPNVWFTGLKPMQELPSWIDSFDVAINPQKMNEVTIGNYPRKIDEYLAMGKPVVATYTEAMQYFRDYVSLASDTESWIKAIAYELSVDSSELKEERIAFARSHSWEANVHRIYDLIKTY